jgi:hypothetical protein
MRTIVSDSSQPKICSGVDFPLELNQEDREKKLVLLWSAKSALFKKAVDIQSELQPLKNSKSRGDRLGTRLKEKIFAALNRRKAGVSNAIKTFCN